MEPTATNRFRYLMWLFVIIAVLIAIAMYNQNIIN
jgi:hypothetical protein